MRSSMKSSTREKPSARSSKEPSKKNISKEFEELLFLPDHKIVTPEEMRAEEKRAYAAGHTEESLMEAAGKEVAWHAMRWLGKFGPREESPRVTLFIGKGNNGGDAWVAARYLFQEGIRVQAVALFPKEECSPLNQLQRKKFERKKGKVVSLEDLPPLEEEDLILDGVLGTGFSGKPKGPILEAIALMNMSGPPVFAIDLPSGVDGETGEGEEAVYATMTLALGAAKRGIFFGEGWEHAGELALCDIGLGSSSGGKESGFFFPDFLAPLLLPKVRRARHKYEAGFVAAYAGSSRFRGAAKLLGLGALRSGAGMVHLLHQEEIGDTPYPLLVSPFDPALWKEVSEKADVLCIGPGLQGEGAALKKLVAEVAKPAVFDAEALQADFSYREGSILTPHEGEARRLLGLDKSVGREALFPRCQAWADKHKSVLLLKGSPTAVFSPERPFVLVPQGAPGMATAGAGDVLTGVIGALRAQGLSPLLSAVVGAALHGLAGESAAAEKTDYGMIATDLLEHLPLVISP